MIAPIPDGGPGGRPFARIRNDATLIWHVTVAWALLTIPPGLLLGTPFWRLPQALLLVSIGLSLGYLIAARCAAWARTRLVTTPGTPVATSLAALTIPLAALFMVILLHPGAEISRSVLLASVLGAGAGILIPLVLERGRLIVAAAGLGLVALIVSVTPSATPSPSVPMAGVRTEVLLTSHGAVLASFYHDWLPRPSRGGGIDRLGDDYFLVTADGEFYRFGWEAGSDSIQLARLPLRLPMNRDRFAAAVGGEIDPETFRAADMLVRAVGDSLQLLVSHHFWHEDRHCFVVRLSEVLVTMEDLADERPMDRWRTLYETRPCLPIKEGRGWPFAGAHIGGRLADPGDGRVLMTIGDHEFDGWNSDQVLPQDTAADYGKILAIDAAGNAERLSAGHRNPQGLHVGEDGSIWSTEHGPQGGDELNRIVPGANYGWPFQTFGTEYGATAWPLADQTEDFAARFETPVFAWVPSVGISNLIEVRKGPVPEWHGDLLIGSLDGLTLFRARRQGDRISYVEPIRLGVRIRDLVEGSDGRLVVWGDGGRIVTLEPSDGASGAGLFASCVGCHSDEAGVTGLGPGLAGVYGRPIASQPDFPYSSALRSREGRWDDRTLDAFLADPQSFAPGSTMRVEGIADPEARSSLIEYLKSLQ